MPDLLERVGFGHHLTGKLRLPKDMEADEGWIDALHDRVVDLEITDDVDALCFHFVDRTGANEGAQGTAVTVGRHSNFTLCRQQDLSLAVHGGHEPLTMKWTDPRSRPK